MDEDIKKQITETIETHKKMTAEFEKCSIKIISAVTQAITRAFEQKSTVYLCGKRTM